MYTKNFVTLILALLVAGILSIITLGILAIPLFIGFQMIFVKIKRGEAAQLNEIFSPLKNFFKLLFGALWMGIIEAAVLIPGILCLYFQLNVLGGILLVAGILLDIYFGVTWMFALLLMYDKGLSINQGLKTSMSLVLKNNFWMHLLLVILVGIVVQIGNLLWGIGALLTTPLGVGAVASAYIEETK